MHFYSFHLAEYAAHTRHLTPMEDLAYRRLLDAYYLAERAPQGTVEQIARSVGLRTELDAVASVLGEFFSSTSEGWINARCERELATYRERREQAAAAGRASGAKRRANGRSTTVQRPFNDRSTPVEQPLNDRSTTVGFQLNHNYKDKDKDKDKDKGSQREIARARPKPEPEPKPEPQTRPSGRSLSRRNQDALKASQSVDAPGPYADTQTRAIVDPTRSSEAREASSVEVSPRTRAPSIEEVIAAWVDAGLPRPSANAEIVIDRAIRLRPDRDLAWCRTYFARVAASPWCRGEIHDHPRCRAWSLEYAIGSDRRVADVLGGRFDPLPEAGARGTRDTQRKDVQRTENGFSLLPLDPSYTHGVSVLADFTSSVPSATVEIEREPEEIAAPALAVGDESPIAEWAEDERAPLKLIVGDDDQSTTRAALAAELEDLPW
jgi:uncharacterized protein YdaU (DUF1376 family)